MYIVFTIATAVVADAGIDFCRSKRIIAGMLSSAVGVRLETK